jgi:hypothetical protein
MNCEFDYLQYRQRQCLCIMEHAVRICAHFLATLKLLADSKSACTRVTASRAHSYNWLVTLMPLFISLPTQHNNKSSLTKHQLRENSNRNTTWSCRKETNVKRHYHNIFQEATWKELSSEKPKLGGHASVATTLHSKRHSSTWRNPEWIFESTSMNKMAYFEWRPPQHIGILGQDQMPTFSLLLLFDNVFACLKQ